LHLEKTEDEQKLKNAEKTEQDRKYNIENSNKNRNLDIEKTENDQILKNVQKTE
jgi:hypothetical protein